MRGEVIVIIIIIIYLFELQMGFTRRQWYYSKTQYTNTHITQNNNKQKHNTQSYTNTQTIKDALHTINTTQKKM
jgi:uncharacterized membrane protein